MQIEPELKVEPRINEIKVTQTLETFPDSPKRRKLLSPIYSLICGHFFTAIILSCFYLFGLYKDNVYFQWGPPIVFFNHTITSSLTFYLPI